jgi:hypothetical protein
MTTHDIDGLPVTVDSRGGGAYLCHVRAGGGSRRVFVRVEAGQGEADAAAKAAGYVSSNPREAAPAWSRGKARR